jgi:hypothetical protein
MSVTRGTDHHGDDIILDIGKETVSRESRTLLHFERGDKVKPTERRIAGEERSGLFQQTGLKILK